MSAFTQFLNEWGPLAGGLVGCAAFGEMLWRKLVIAPRARQRDRAAVAALRELRTSWDLHGRPAELGRPDAMAPEAIAPAVAELRDLRGQAAAIGGVAARCVQHDR